MEPSTPPPQNKRQEADIIRKTRFFHAIDNRASNVTIKDVCETENVSHGTGKLWLKQRKRLNAAAFRRTDKFRSDRRKKESSELLIELLDSQRNPVRDYP